MDSTAPSRYARVLAVLLLASMLVACVCGHAADLQMPGESAGQSFLASLSEAERDWLRRHRDIRLGIDPAWEPFEFLDDAGRYRGMAAEYIELINAMLDVQMAPARGLSWSEVIARAQKSEIDVLPCVVKTPQREQYLDFTRSYLSFPMVVATRADALALSGLDDLRGQKIGVVRGYATADLLQTHYPDLQQVEFGTLQQGLDALVVGEIPAFVDNLASIVDLINKRGLSNVKVAAQTPFAFELGIGVRKDWPELVRILDKALAAIPSGEADQIRENWVPIRLELGADWAQLIRGALIAGALALLIIGIIFHWNRRLLAEVEQRKHVEDLLAHRNQIHESIAAGADLEDVLNTLVSNVETECPDTFCAVVLLDQHCERCLLYTSDAADEYQRG